MTTLIDIIECAAMLSLGISLQNITSGPRNNRGKHVLLPVISLVYCVAAVILLTRYYGQIKEMLTLQGWLHDSTIVAANLAVLYGFSVVKMVLVPLINSLWTKRDLIEQTTWGWYAYDDYYDTWFLKKQWANFRTYLLALVIALAATAGILVVLAWSRGDESAFWIYSFPCAAVVVMNEIHAFMNGNTKEEYEHSVSGDDADSRRISNYYKVREMLENILPGPLLTAHTGYEFHRKETAADFIRDLSKSEVHEDIITADYFSTENRVARADLDCVKATYDIMNRRNVVFLNPFYRDLTLYLTLPVMNALLSGRKVLLITGKKSAEDDAQEWISDLLRSYTRLRSLYRVDKLDKIIPDCEVGVLSFPKLYDNDVMTENMQFLRDTDLVILIEPSYILNTGQVALNMIAEEMEVHGQSPTYVIIDRNADGLVDTVSHVLHADITTVVAPPVPRNIYTGMMWDADGDYGRQSLFYKQTKYLGNGVELAAVAIRNQIPKVTWYSDTKVPVRDVRWIAGQYSTNICRYMNVPAQQKALEDRIEFSEYMWSNARRKEQFLIVEDEYCNMFNTMRAFLSRGEAQSFVNVLSENYLLRDYMRYNSQMFLASPNAIPSIVPGYAKTERNTLVKLVLRMLYRPVQEEEVLEEFRIVGKEALDAHALLAEMLAKYTFADMSVLDIHIYQKENGALGLVKKEEYRINHEAFSEFFSKTIEKAFFILENEEYESEYIDAKLYGHVAQTLLPGQFVTYAGKYYSVRHISPKGGVVMRRASDHFDRRSYYRQIRHYNIETSEAAPDRIRTVGDIEIAWLHRDMSVRTTGYLDMDDNHDLKNAKIVDFSSDPSTDLYSRRYHNKSLIRVRLPEVDEGMNFTLCMLMQELFRSTFPDAWPYIAVLTRKPAEIDGMLDYLVYDSQGEIEDGYIYFVEDSDIDLGLLEAIENNLMKLLKVISDFLDWHEDKLNEPAPPAPAPVSVSVERQEPESAQKRKQQAKKKSWWQRLKEFLIAAFRIFDHDGQKPEETDAGSEEPETAEQPETEETPETPETPETAEQTEEAEDTSEAAEETGATEDTSEAADQPDAPEGTADTEETASEAPDAAAAEPGADAEDEAADVSIEAAVRLVKSAKAAERASLSDEAVRYRREGYLNFGYDAIDSRLRIDDLREYMRQRGWSSSQYKDARTREIVHTEPYSNVNVNRCDFCGQPLNGVSYEALSDGRVRCNDCSSTAIETVDEFKELFFQTLDMMETLYGIKFREPVRVKTTDAKTIAKGVGRIFVPSTEYAARTLGFAQNLKGRYSVVIENGSPRLAAVDTMVHEMTHIWQYLNWNDAQIRSIYGMGDPGKTALARLIVYEGMAMWAAIQYLYQIGETYYAEMQEALTAERKDEYGIGFLIFREQYPFVKDSGILKYTPFTAFPPVEPALVKAVVDSITSG